MFDHAEVHIRIKEREECAASLELAAGLAEEKSRFVGQVLRNAAGRLREEGRLMYGDPEADTPAGLIALTCNSPLDPLRILQEIRSEIAKTLPEDMPDGLLARLYPLIRDAIAESARRP